MKQTINGKEYDISPGVDLRAANLKGAYLTGANLTEANLTGANLTWADLRNANLKGVDLGRANLRGANLEGADLEGAYISGTDLVGANLRRANLKGANLRNANLTGADLKYTNLYRADLEGAGLAKVYLTDTKLEERTVIDIESSKLNLSNEQILRRIVDPIVQTSDSCHLSDLEKLRDSKLTKEPIKQREGEKYDEGKPMFSCLPAKAIMELGRVAELGARKYGLHNYRKGINVSRTLDAAMRHLLHAIDGEERDAKDGNNHLASAAWNCLVALNTLIERPDLDDRWKKNASN